MPGKTLRISVTPLFTGIFKFYGNVKLIVIVSYYLGNNSGIWDHTVQKVTQSVLSIDSAFD